MNYEEVVLIGGHSDGQRISVRRGVDEVLLPKPPRPGYTDIDDKGIASDNRVIDITSYKRTDLRGPSGFVVVYVVDGVDPIKALVDGYRSP